MARRKFSRRQVQPRETLSTLLILGSMLLVFSVFTLPYDAIIQISISLLIIITLLSISFYYFSYRKQMIYREGLRQLRLDEVDAMSGVKFEEYVAELFRQQGYKIQTTALSGDYGIDLITIKDGIRTAIQIKRYSRRVNQTAVREAVAGMKRYKCSQSMVVTNSDFTKFAVDLAKTNECILVDREKLIEMIAARENKYE